MRFAGEHDSHQIRRSRRAANAACRLLAALACLLWQSSALAAEPANHVDAAAVDSAPVVVDGIELFRVAGATSLPSAERASTVRARIIELARDPSVAPSDIRLARRDTRIDVVAGTRHIVGIVELDASIDNLTIADAAQVRAQRIQRAIERYRAERRPDALTNAALLALVASVGIVLALFVTVMLFRRVLPWVEGRVRRRARGVSIRSFEIVGTESMWRAVSGVLRGLRALLIAALVYVYLTWTLRLFPHTRGFAVELLDLIVEPLRAIGSGIVDYIPKLIFLLMLFIVVRYALKLLHAISRAIAAGTLDLPGFDAEWAQPTYNIVRILIVLLALVVAYPYLPGSGSPAFQGLSIFAGLMLSLGASSAMASVIAGYTVTYRRAYRPGDRITIGEFTGDVTEVRLMVTQLRTPKNEEIVVPNSLVLQSHIVNYSKFAKTCGLILHTTVGIGYETPWRQVEAMLLVAAARTSGVLQAPEPFVLVKSLGDFAVTYELNVHVDGAREMLERYAALHRNILDVFNEHGVQIMTPAYEGDPEQPKIVPKEQWYADPARRPNDSITEREPSAIHES